MLNALNEELQRVTAGKVRVQDYDSEEDTFAIEECITGEWIGDDTKYRASESLDILREFPADSVDTPLLPLAKEREGDVLAELLQRVEPILCWSDHDWLPSEQQSGGYEGNQSHYLYLFVYRGNHYVVYGSASNWDVYQFNGKATVDDYLRELREYCQINEEEAKEIRRLAKESNWQLAQEILDEIAPWYSCSECDDNACAKLCDDCGSCKECCYCNAHCYESKAEAREAGLHTVKGWAKLGRRVKDEAQPGGYTVGSDGHNKLDWYGESATVMAYAEARKMLPENLGELPDFAAHDWLLENGHKDAAEGIRAAMKG